MLRGSELFGKSSMSHDFMQDNRKPIIMEFCFKNMKFSLDSGMGGGTQDMSVLSLLVFGGAHFLRESSFSLF